MSNSLNSRQAAIRWANGHNDFRHTSALSFEGDIAYSYSEPIAIRIGADIFLTDHHFSMTSAIHRSKIVSGWVRSNRSGDLHTVHHRVIRELARERGAYCGPWGRRFDSMTGRPAAEVVAAKVAA